MKRVAVVGGGFGGLSAAALLAKKGFKVQLFEKNETTGGRARYFTQGAYRFDMGPSWYLMPEVFDRFFGLAGKKTEDMYELARLDPTYRVFFGEGESVDITTDRAQVERIFDQMEPGCAARFRSYMKQAQYKYTTAIEQFLYRDYRSLRQFFNKTLLIEGSRLQVFTKLDTMVSRYFKDRRIQQILEYAMVFLGTDPSDAPSMYSLMSHVDINQGVFYPREGLAGAAQAISRLAEELGVEILTASPVEKILHKNGKASGVQVHGEKIDADAVLINADYAHAEMSLMPDEYVSYPAKYWEKRVLAPSMFILFIGLNKTLKNLVHHNLYFQPVWQDHFNAIFKKPGWPEDPCFYLSAISKTDGSAAPQGCENLFVLVPSAPGLSDSDEQRESYARSVIAHIERVTGESITEHIDVMRIYSQRDFAADYNAFKGTALGLSHTLFQTAVFRPHIRSKKLGGCYFAGQYTHPGVGVPMVLIAAELAANALASEVS